MARPNGSILYDTHTCADGKVVKTYLNPQVVMARSEEEVVVRGVIGERVMYVKRLNDLTGPALWEALAGEVTAIRAEAETWDGKDNHHER